MKLYLKFANYVLSNDQYDRQGILTLVNELNSRCWKFVNNSPIDLRNSLKGNNPELN
jgi:hypothetical protein